MFLYSSLLALALVVSAPWWLWRMLTSNRYRAGLRDRLGILPRCLDGTIAHRGAAPGLIWLHAVSVGEVLAAERLIAELPTAFPGYQIVVSTTTATGNAVARQKLACPVFYFPLDFAFAVRPYLRALRPTLILLVESELWPRFLHEAKQSNIPVAVVNARVSDRSFRRTKAFRKLWLKMASRVTLFLAQGEETATRLKTLGVMASKIEVPGNLKYDRPGGGDNEMARRIGGMLFEARLIIGGSTADGEEQLLIDAFGDVIRVVPNAALLLAPRHPERFDEVERMLRASGNAWFRCSHLLKQTEPIFPGCTLLLDTIGDLASMYAIASAAFIGGSLVPRGGQNPNEAVRFGVPVIMGPFYENFREMVDVMRISGAVKIVERSNLADGLIAALAPKPLASSDFQGLTGATARTLTALQDLLK